MNTMYTHFTMQWNRYTPVYQKCLRYIQICSRYVPFVLQNICRPIIYCTQGLTLFYHISYKDEMHISLEFYSK